MQPQTVEAVLLIAADAISASRPGARGESLEHYVKRLESLEQLAANHPGVEKVYALQAGREIRVLVKPHEIDDDGAVLLSHEIAREIEDHLEYPGQIKVTVIRESRAVDVASNKVDVRRAARRRRRLALERRRSARSRRARSGPGAPARASRRAARAARADGAAALPQDRARPSAVSASP